MNISAPVWTVIAAAAAGLIKLLFTYLSTYLEKRKWARKYAESAAPPEGPPAPVFAPVAQAAPLPPVPAFEQQGIRVKHLLIETDLLEAQEAIRRLSWELEDKDRRLRQVRADLVAARVQNDELIAAAGLLKKEYEKMRMEGLSSEPRKRQSPIADDRGVLHRDHTSDRLLPPPNRKGRSQGD